MPNWKRIVGKFFQLADPQNEYEHHAGTGASLEEILEIQVRWGVEFPAEFHGLYQQYNGVGLVDRESRDAMPLLIRPLEEFAEYVEHCRSRFDETHPDEASRYFPFIDWGNGDSSGYWRNRKGRLEAAIYTFAHELYKYDSSQPVSEFIEPHSPSIAKLLGPR